MDFATMCEHVPTVAVKEPDGEDRPRPVGTIALNPMRVCWIALCWLAAQGMSVGIVTLATAAFLQLFPLAHTISKGGEIVINAVAAMIATALALRMFRKSFGNAEQYRTALGVRAVRWHVLLLSAAAGVALSLILTYGLVLQFPPSSSHKLSPVVVAMQEGGAIQLSVFLCVMFVAPVLEELLFRGVLFAGFAASWSAFAAACVVTLLFVLLHVTSLPLYWPGLVAVALVGAFVQFLRAKTASIWPGLGIHIAYNTTLCVLALLY